MVSISQVEIKEYIVWIMCIWHHNTVVRNTTDTNSSSVRTIVIASARIRYIIDCTIICRTIIEKAQKKNRGK